MPLSLSRWRSGKRSQRCQDNVLRGRGLVRLFKVLRRFPFLDRDKARLVRLDRVGMQRFKRERIGLLRED